MGSGSIGGRGRGFPPKCGHQFLCGGGQRSSTAWRTPGAVPHTSTYALTNVTLPYALALANKGWEQALNDDQSLARGLNTHAGQVTYAPRRARARTRVGSPRHRLTNPHLSRIRRLATGRRTVSSPRPPLSNEGRGERARSVALSASSLQKRGVQRMTPTRNIHRHKDFVDDDDYASAPARPGAGVRCRGTPARYLRNPPERRKHDLKELTLQPLVYEVM